MAVIEVPDHYVPTIATAMLEYAGNVIVKRGFVPAFVHQMADAWDERGLNPGPGSDFFWEAVARMNSGAGAIIHEQGLVK